jgi:hypothetical protein
MDFLDKRPFLETYDHIAEYINTNIQKTTASTTKYMKHVWNKARIKSTVNVCF